MDKAEKIIAGMEQLYQSAQARYENALQSYEAAQLGGANRGVLHEWSETVFRTNCYRNGVKDTLDLAKEFAKMG